MSTNPTFDGALQLDDWGVIRASGADATGFLHGQLSNDITGMGPDQARLAAYCTAKGRMLASFVVCRGDDEDFWLACPRSVLASALKRLRMFVLRSKVVLDDAAASIAVAGLAGDSAAAPISAVATDPVWSVRRFGGAAAIRLPNGPAVPRWMLVGSHAALASCIAKQRPLPPDTWRWLEVQSAVVPVVAETVEQFVPQMINYELVGGVNFKKGCYPGQEIVARSQYLGKLKRRGVLLHAASDTPALPGQDVFWSGDPAQPSGMVAAAAPCPAGGWDALVELKTSALEGGSLHLGSAQGTALAVLPLPYAIPDSAN